VNAAKWDLCACIYQGLFKVFKENEGQCLKALKVKNGFESDSEQPASLADEITKSCGIWRHTCENHAPREDGCGDRAPPMEFERMNEAMEDEVCGRKTGVVPDQGSFAAGRHLTLCVCEN